MFLLYEGLLYLVFLAGLPFFLLVGLIRGKYLKNLSERLGFYRTTAGAHELWVHAVSVGEALAAKPIVDALLRLRPGTTVVVTTTTLTGQAQAQRLFPSFTVTYFPFDLTLAVGRFLRHHRPRVFATIETEIWPNVTRLARGSGVRLAIANGRISDRSFPRYRALRSLLAPILAKYDRVLVRESVDVERFIAIGAPAAIVERTGNVKFDFEPDLTPLAGAEGLERQIAGRTCVVLGSTIDGEDEVLVPAIVRLARDAGLFFIVAPRKPERFAEVERLLGAAGLRVARRSGLSEAAAVMPAADVMLLDTHGELARIYRYAAAAFVGGSLVDRGGHNPIEPAALGVPVCFGPSMWNFREIASAFLRAGGATQIRDAAEFEAFVRLMTSDAGAAREAGSRGRAVVLENRGASERTARRILELLP